MRILIAKFTLAYFGCVFGVGFLLGIVRVLWLVPLLGERMAELLEIPVRIVRIKGPYVSDAIRRAGMKPGERRQNEAALLAS